MPGESCVNAITLMLFFVTLLPLLAVEATYSRTENGLAKSTDTFDREDLSAMLRRAPFHDARVFEIARKHIQEIETSPACHQLATSTLINSCQSFSSLPGKDSARITDNSLDEVRQEYAARLAVCELQGIKSGIPRECVPFLASHEACPRASPSGFFRKNRPVLYEPRRACYPEFTPQQLKQCVDSLFDHGQRWTSYSNAQTNAIVICQASRGAVENEQHLHKLQDALQSQARVSETLSRAVQETEDRLAQHHDFAKAVQQFQHELAARNEAALTQADSMVARIVGRIDSTAEALLTALTNSLKTAADKTMSLTRNIDTVNHGVYKTRVALQELHEEAVVREAQRAASQDLALKVHQALSSDVQAMLEHLRDVTVLDLAERIIEFESTMVDFFGTQQQTFHDHFHEVCHCPGVL
ncbi:hypothetical protein B0J12DRAFT_403282 [Macrophomina phaseolina]|uniref:Nuclear membrane fusion protein Kar5 n=1 Tax=Macrophomina phaseolina TaxID=35725 RepID=A0ABQ8GLK3_9PEZI|nr:hypothetical protein B0J12DRAFT_403282 [Macrophomina phaseolina]